MFRIPIRAPIGVLPRSFFVKSIPLFVEYAVTVSSSPYDETINLHWSAGENQWILNASFTFLTDATYISDIAFLKHIVLGFQKDGALWLTLELFANAVAAFEEAAGVKTNIGDMMSRAKTK